MHLDKAEEGLLFNEEALKKVHGVESGELLSIVKCKHDQATVRMTMINSQAFMETRQCIEARLTTQRENQQQVSD